MRGLLISTAALCLLPGAAQASETVGYGYDALGRLTTVTHGGSSAVKVTYTLDKADNRTNVTVTGASGNGTAATPMQSGQAPDYAGDGAAPDADASGEAPSSADPDPGASSEATSGY